MKFGRVLAVVALVVGVVAWPLGVLAADYGGGNVKGYAADSPLDYGTVVELTGENSNRVKPATQEEMQNMFGVVVDPQTLSVRLSGEAVENETYVAVSGTYNVLVSTQGGEIVAGDHLTMSAINGVAMKASTEESTVVGRAVGSFSGKGVVLGSASIKDVDGNTTQSVALGSVPVTVDIKNNPNEKSTKVNVPEFLERTGQAIAEKEVSPVRIYLSVIIAAVSLVAGIIVLYSGVRSGIISIGRNPMSRKSIFRALVQTILTSFLILIIGLFAVYLLLRL